MSLFHHADVECWCQVCSQLQYVALCFLTFVVDAISEHIVEANSHISLVTAFYIVCNVFLCLPNFIEETILSMGMILTVVFSMCLLYASSWSLVIISILNCLCMSHVMLLIIVIFCRISSEECISHFVRVH